MCVLQNDKLTVPTNQPSLCILEKQIQSLFSDTVQWYI